MERDCPLDVQITDNELLAVHWNGHPKEGTNTSHLATSQNTMIIPLDLRKHNLHISTCRYFKHSVLEETAAQIPNHHVVESGL